MLTSIILLLGFAFAISIVALVYTNILPLEPGFNKWYRFLKWITRGNEYFFKPLIDCCKCFAGQCALWGYLITFSGAEWAGWQHGGVRLFHVEQWGHSYCIGGHVFTVCAAILFADLITKIYNKYF